MSVSDPPSLPPYVCLAGPTASGKTALALGLAERFAVEIISVDSALVYQGMDIGTAKPSAQELAMVPHHLIDIRDPLAPYSAAEFARDAQHLIREIHQRRKLPLLVGGTMLYFKALMNGLDDMPASDPQVRAEVEAQALSQGWPALHAQLQHIDPITAARLSPQDAQRIQRALEVWHVSGRPLSSFHQQSQQQPTAPPLFISLEPHDRLWLHHRIAQRFALMLSQGFVQEVEALRARGDLHAHLPSMRAVGYRQVWEMLEGRIPEHELLDRGIFATRQLAKRQITWLRSMPFRTQIACDQHTPAQMLDLMASAVAPCVPR